MNAFDQLIEGLKNFIRRDKIERRATQAVVAFVLGFIVYQTTMILAYVKAIAERCI